MVGGGRVRNLTTQQSTGWNTKKTYPWDRNSFILVEPTCILIWHQWICHVKMIFWHPLYFPPILLLSLWSWCDAYDIVVVANIDMPNNGTPNDVSGLRPPSEGRRMRRWCCCCCCDCSNSKLLADAVVVLSLCCCYRSWFWSVCAWVRRGSVQSFTGAFLDVLGSGALCRCPGNKMMGVVVVVRKVLYGAIMNSVLVSCAMLWIAKKVDGQPGGVLLLFLRQRHHLLITAP